MLAVVFFVGRLSWLQDDNARARSANNGVNNFISVYIYFFYICKNINYFSLNQ